MPARKIRPKRPAPPVVGGTFRQRNLEPQHRYVPVLKSRQGELAALSRLHPRTRARLCPLVELTEVDWDWKHTRPKRTVADHATRLGDGIVKSWPHRETIWIDGILLDDAKSRAVPHPVEVVLAKGRASGVPMVPVTGLARSSSYNAAVGRILAEDGRGVAFRVMPDDIGPRLDWKRVTLTVGALGLTPSEVDLVVDIQSVHGSPASLLAPSVARIVASIPNVDAWRSVTLVMGAFPQDQSGFPGGTVSDCARSDWAIWLTVVGDGDLPRKPAYGDYAIQHPLQKKIDPRLMRRAAGIRYTETGNWKILKGFSVAKKKGQERPLAEGLTRQPWYSGFDFSAGDYFIDQCAKGKTGPGSATTWRFVGTSHHLEYVVHQLATTTGT